ncbi:hypothetical protein GCM10027168_47840 [Streptomyces capparidis]
MADAAVPVPAADGTGDPQVDAVLAQLDAVAGLGTGDHVAVFEDVHEGLRGVLTALDSGAEQGGS